MSNQPFVAYQPDEFDPDVCLAKAADFRQWLEGRRTVRDFDPSKPVSRAVMEEILLAAGTAPSGAHKQPWTFVAISSNELKAKIRAACEAQEKEFYEQKITDEWRADLEPLGTDFVKEHITDAPWVVVLFAQRYGMENGEKRKHYYVSESVGIAAGFFLAAVRQAGLVSLTHTPSPMGFLRDILGRPDNEEAFLLLPVGYAAPDCKVPDLARKGLDDFVVWK